MKIAIYHNRVTISSCESLLRCLLLSEHSVIGLFGGFYDNFIPNLMHFCWSVNIKTIEVLCGYYICGHMVQDFKDLGGEPVRYIAAVIDHGHDY